MEIYDKDTLKPRYMRHIYDAHIGKNVVVYTLGSIPLGGILKDYNGYIIHLVGRPGTETYDTYIPCDKIVAFCGEE